MNHSTRKNLVPPRDSRPARELATRPYDEPTPAISSGRTLRDLVWLTIAAGFLFFVALGARDLWNPNEPIYGTAVAEMANRGDWTVPTVNGRVFAEKPILYFWLARVSSIALGGVSELALRAPSAIAGIVSVLLTYLLVVPYVGRRRALITVALFATLYQVFWASRSVQMDILVLATTLGAVLPLSRMLDFGMRPSRAWSLVGVATGIGIIAKGPVTWVLPGLVVLFYAISEKKLRVLLGPWLIAAAIITLLIGAPWYLALWLSGDTAFLREVLIRQNFNRFVDAWDHVQPWWYYLEYLWIDYAPWSLLLPAVLLSPASSGTEQKLERMSWIWIAAIVFFFSLSDSKRAPYILPIAPAVAVLAASVVDRWTTQTLPTRGRTAAAFAFGTIIGALLVGGAYGALFHADAPPFLQTHVLGLGVFLAASGAVMALITTNRRARRHLPAALLVIFSSFYLTAVTTVLPTADAVKSAREFSTAMNEAVETRGGTLASYGLWQWRSGYAFYAQRQIPNLRRPEELRFFWKNSSRPFLLVEARDRRQMGITLPDAVLVLEERIGGRTAFLFRRATSGPDRTGSTSRPDEERSIVPSL